MNNSAQKVQRITLVLADDLAFVRQSIRYLLRDWEEFEIVGEAADGKETVDLVTKMHPDILITDLKMPKTRGMEIIYKVKKSSPDTKIIVCSMHDARAYVYSAFKAGADGYIPKNSEMSRLGTAIHDVAKGKRYLGPPLSEEGLQIYCLKRNKPLLLQERLPS
jgi:DNA-binding NarL/FixJ family response regulator